MIFIFQKFRNPLSLAHHYKLVIDTKHALINNHDLTKISLYYEFIYNNYKTEFSQLTQFTPSDSKVLIVERSYYNSIIILETFNKLNN